jgi:hypothetical protein
MGQNLATSIAQRLSNAFGYGSLGQQSDLSTSQRHGKRYWSVYGLPAGYGGKPANTALAGANFRGANLASAPATLSAGLATTYVGLCLSNPAASTVNLVLKQVAGTIVVAPAGELALGLITGWSAAGVVTHTTALTPISGYVGAAASAGSVVGPATQAKLDQACTIVGTPAWDRWFAAGPASTNNVSFSADMEDDVIIPPGGYAAIGANVAGPAAGFLGSMQWEELPA